MPRVPGRSTISRDELHELTRPLIGLPVSHTWRGHGSAIFLEVGAVTTGTRRTGAGREYAWTCGDVTMMLEWSWRVESPRTIRFGSWSREARITRGLPTLENRSILDISVEGRLPELVVALTGGRWVHTFMTAEGQPAWALRLQDDSWLAVVRGRLVRQRRSARHGGLPPGVP